MSLHVVAQPARLWQNDYSSRISATLGHDLAFVVKLDKQFATESYEECKQSQRVTSLFSRWIQYVTGMSMSDTLCCSTDCLFDVLFASKHNIT